MKTNRFMAALAAVLPCCAAMAQTPVVDGTRDASYIQIGVQNNQTGFGDSNLGTADYANGSELDNISYYRDSNFLYIFIGGNLESNFNKLELFFDTGVGGDNRLLGGYTDVDFNALARLSDDGSSNGLTFDGNFNARYWYGLTCGNGPPLEIYANFDEVKAASAGGTGYYLGTTTNGVGALTGGNNPNGVEATVNNSNIAGVTGGDLLDGGSGASVTTGMEFKIPLVEIGNPTGAIKVCAIINGSGHDYVSNQVLGGLGGSVNLADPRFVNFSTIAGDQFVEIPAPSATLLPTSLSASGQLGTITAGDVNSLAADDANFLKLCKGFVPSLSSPKIRISANFTSPFSTVSSVTLDARARMSTVGVFQIRGFVADMTNVATPVYGAPNQVIPNGTGINTTYANYAGNSTNVAVNVGTGGAMQARLEIQQTGFSAVTVPCTEFEKLNLVVNP